MSYRVRGVPSGKSAINHHIFKPSTTPATAPNSFEEQLPQYFIVRPDVTKHTASGRVTTKGPMVPLIPMDQLPSWLEIVGVPRELDIEQMRGLKNLGEAPGDFSWYEVCLTNRCLRSNKGPIQATNGELKRQQSDSSSEQPLRKTVAAVAGEQHTTGGSKTTVNSHNTNRICSKPGRRDRSNINVHQRTDTALRSSGSDSDSRGVRRPSLSSSSKASASGSTHSDMTCHSQRKAGIGASRHATPDCTEPIAAPREVFAAADYHRTTLSEQDSDVVPDETLEARLREAEREDLELELQMQQNQAEKEKKKREDKGIQGQVTEENLMDF